MRDDDSNEDRRLRSLTGWHEEEYQVMVLEYFSALIKLV